MDIRERLKAEAEKLNIPLTKEMADRLQLYLDFLLEKNQVMNLTAITDPWEAAVKHFLDSLLLLRAAELPQSSSFADVGTGAGFPGVPVKIARPDLSLVLIDSLQKRLTFLDELLQKLSLSAETVHGRAEDCGRAEEHREKYDTAAARAVAALPALAEYCLPLVKEGGLFIAMKSVKAEEEEQAARHAIGVLGGELEKAETFVLPGDMTRTIFVIRKVRSTPEKYPRRGVKIAKNPL